MPLKRVPYILLAIGSIGIGVYPILYFFVNRNFGLLGSKSDVLLADWVWNGMFYTHIGMGGLALLVGWIQFNKKIQRTRMELHRNFGKMYMVAVLISGISGLYIAYHATGGLSSQLGFIGLGLTWLYTTFRGYTSIRKKDVETHQKMMIYSYAACFAAVTLRIWLPLLSKSFGAFLPAYRIVAWLCWIPNIIVAYFIIQNITKSRISTH